MSDKPSNTHIQSIIMETIHYTGKRELNNLFHRKMSKNFKKVFPTVEGLPGSSDTVKNLLLMILKPGSISCQEDSPGEENGNPLQYSLLENSMNRGRPGVTVPGLQRVRHFH